MPKIVVNEKDLSWYHRRRAPGQLVVLMPGISSWGPYEPVLVDNSNFLETLGDAPVGNNDISYRMASSFVEVGINVLFWRIDIGATLASGETSSTYDPYDHTKVVSSGLKITAKYYGKFGNQLKAKVVSKGDSIFVTVSHKTTGVIYESLVYNFNNPDSPYYYEIVNRTTSYVEVEPAVPGSPVKLVPAETDAFVSLENGKDYDDTVTDPVNEAVVKLKDPQNDSVSDIIQNLKDLLVYDFTVIVDGGLNDLCLALEEQVTENHVENENVVVIDPETGDTISNDVNPSENAGTVEETEQSTLKISAIDEILLDIAKSRGDAVYLVSGVRDQSADDFYTYCGLPQTDEGSSIGKGFNTSYAAGFGPWVLGQLVSTGTLRVLPGYYALLVSWGKSIASGSPIWMAPAGVKRSSLGNLVRELIPPIGSAVIDMWQNQDFISNNGSVRDVYKVNPIVKLKQYGYVVYGNSTLLHNQFDGSTSMLQSFSTRILANQIKKRAFDISLSLQFDQLDDEIFAEFKVMMSTYMDQLRYGGALYDYNIVADRSAMTLDDLNSRTVPIRIMISPNPAAENFVINLEISQAGVDFSDDTDGYGTGIVTESI